MFRLRNLRAVGEGEARADGSRCTAHLTQESTRGIRSSQAMPEHRRDPVRALPSLGERRCTALRSVPTQIAREAKVSRLPNKPPLACKTLERRRGLRGDEIDLKSAVLLQRFSSPVLANLMARRA
jgi:hypothetical protein